MVILFDCYLKVSILLYVRRSNWRSVESAFVQYSFTGNPHCVISKPHDNSKSSLKFIRTTPSTLRKLKESCKKKSPKESIHLVTNEKGASKS